MVRDLSAYLQDVLEACTAIEDVMSGISLEEYRSNRAVIDDAVFGLVYSGLIVLKAEFSELLHCSRGAS
jgi:uncharacterized protein with HEPN domain